MWRRSLINRLGKTVKEVVECVSCPFPSFLSLFLTSPHLLPVDAPRQPAPLSPRVFTCQPFFVPFSPLCFVFLVLCFNSLALSPSSLCMPHTCSLLPFSKRIQVVHKQQHPLEGYDTRTLVAVSFSDGEGERQQT